MGVMPVDEQKERFESLFTYDPSREETTVDAFKSNLESLRKGAESSIGRTRAASSSVGAGFSGFGERERIVSEAMRGIADRRDMGIESAQRGLFEDIRGQRDKFMADAMSSLSDLELSEGTRDRTAVDVISELSASGNLTGGSPNFTPPDTASAFPAMGTDGNMYVWNPSTQSWRRI